MGLNKTSKGKVLDIGSGWGYCVAFLGNLSKDLDVSGIAITKNLIDFSKNRYQKYQKNINYYLRDYRDINETYDAIVSIEVLEHFGLQNMQLFSNIAYEHLKPGGKLVVQYNYMTNIYAEIFGELTRENGCRGANYASKHVYPGGCLIHADWLSEAAHKSGFLLLEQEEIAIYHGRTFRLWREKLMENYKDLMKTYPNKYTLRLIRKFEIYLALTEASYITHRVGVVQQVYYKPLKPMWNTKESWVYYSSDYSM